MPTSEEILQAQVREASVPIYMTSYAEISEYLQEQKGQRGWVGALAQMLSGSPTRSAKGQTEKQFLEYKAARRAIERIESGQHQGFGEKYAGKFPEIGKQLPPIGLKPPPGGYNVWFSMDIWISRAWYTRSKTVRITGYDAYQFFQAPSDADITAAYFALSGQDDMAEDWSNQRYAVTPA